MTHRTKGEPKVKTKWAWGAGGFRGLWVHRVDGYTMLMSPLRVAPGSRQLSMTAQGYKGVRMRTAQAVGWCAGAN